MDNNLEECKNSFGGDLFGEIMKEAKCNIKIGVQKYRSRLIY